MTRQNLAKKLVAAKSERERNALLHKNAAHADSELAVALKAICYAAWTDEPTKAKKTAKAIRSFLKFKNDPEIAAYAFWISGIADLTDGKLESTIKNLDRSAQAFKGLGKPHEAANTQVAKLYALALLGRYDEAVQCGRDSLKKFVRFGDEIAAGKIEKNLGNIVARQGNERLAEKFYHSARERFLKEGDLEELTMADNSLANTYAELNDFLSAEKFYSSALKSAKAAKMLVTEAEIEASMGNLAKFRGRFDEALKLLETSRRKYEALKMPHQSAVAELEIADIYLDLNLSQEAISIFEKTAKEFRKLKSQGEEARARTNWGKAAVLLRETSVAKTQLELAAGLYLAEKNKIGAASVKLIQADLELDQKNFKNVLALSSQAEELLLRSENQRHLLMAKLLSGEALRHLGKFREAEMMLLQTFERAEKEEQKNIALNAQNALGNLALETGNHRDAKKHFENAVDYVESLRAPLPAEEFRMAFLADKLAPYENLAKIAIQENELERAFMYLEKARSRSLGENLVHIDQANSKVSSKLAEKHSKLREELNWIYSRLDRVEATESGKLSAEARNLENQISKLIRQIESTKVLKRVNKSGEGAFLKTLQKRIGKNRALIEFVNFDGYLSAFVLTGSEIGFIGALGKESEIVEILEGLQFQFGVLRFGSKSLEKFMPDLKIRADSYLKKLYEKLLKPLEAYFRKRDLVIVPVGALHYVPFQALKNGKEYLVESREVVYSPSATVWNKLQQKRARTPETAMLFGFADASIPLVDSEIETLGKIFDRSNSFTGTEASFANYIKNAPRSDILHIACHGQFRPENPLFSSLHLSDGYITVRDICGQKLKAELVTLSACETGMSKISAGEEILGLARGFLTAGASSLVLSLWTVNDEATTVLMKALYIELQRGKTVSASLRKAQKKFIEKGAHPYFWSPFVIIGK